MVDREDKPRIVLVVEDELLIRMMVSDSLLDAGFEVSEAATGEAALQTVETRGMELSAVILDVGLPDIKGDVLVGKIRALRAELPIIVTTGYDITDLAKRFANDAHIRLLAKPYQPEALILILNEWKL